MDEMPKGHTDFGWDGWDTHAYSLLTGVGRQHVTHARPVGEQPTRTKPRLRARARDATARPRDRGATRRPRERERRACADTARARTAVCHCPSERHS